MKNILYSEIEKRWLKDKGSIWIISDTHFGDLESYKFRYITGMMLVNGKKHYRTSGNIWEDEDSLKCSMECFDEWQIKNINAKAGKNDTLIILGDIGDIEYVKKLKAGYKVLILGNHDKGASNYKYFTTKEGELSEYLVKGKYRVYDDFEDFEEIILAKSLEEAKEKGFKDLIIKENSRSLFTKEPEVTCLNRIKGFDEVYEGPLMINDRLILSHEPISYLKGCPYLFNIYGHDHGKLFEMSNGLNVCAEHINYTPLNLLGLIKKGLLKDIEDIHRVAIDKQKERGKKKDGKDITHD